MSVAAEFGAVLHAAGLAAERVIADGALHRVRIQGDRGGQRSGWYVLHLGDGMAAGAFGNWKTGDAQRWRDGQGARMGPAERIRMQTAVAHATRRQAAERGQRHHAARRAALARWQAAAPADAAHPYLAVKGVSVYGIRQEGEWLLVPLHDSAGALWNVQTIAPDGTKRFAPGGRKQGLYHAIGRMAGEVLCVAEGYATAATVHEATGHATAVAFDAGNLEPVARALRRKYPRARLIVCADDDAGTNARIGRNPGLEAATRAAQAVAGAVALPPR